MPPTPDPSRGLYRDDPLTPTRPTAQAPVIVLRPPPSKRERFFSALLGVLRATVRVLLYAVVFALSSVGMTALINEQLRVLLLEPFVDLLSKINLYGGIIYEVFGLPCFDSLDSYVVAAYICRSCDGRKCRDEC